MSSTDLRIKAAQVDAQAARQSRALYLGLSFNVVLFLGLTFVFPLPLQRVGCVCTALGWACVVFQMYRQRVGQKISSGMGAPSIDFWKTNLARQRNFAAAWPWFLAAVPGPVMFFVGAAQQYPNMRRFTYVIFPLFLSLVVSVVFAQVRRAKKYQLQIDELTQLQNGQV